VSHSTTKFPKVFLTSCIGLDHDIILLDQFCHHYRSLGIDSSNFLLVLNTSDHRNISNNIRAGLDILNGHGIEPLDVWCTRYESHEKWQRVHNILNKKVEPEDWVVHPDGDEFHEIPNGSYKNLLAEFDSLSINAVQGILIDRLSSDHKIPPNESFKNPFDHFPVCADLNSLLRLTGAKLMAYRGYLRANNGSGQIHQDVKSKTIYPHGKSTSLHETPPFIKWVGDPDYNNREKEPEDWTAVMPQIKKDIKYIVHHFKWHGRVIEKLKERVETYTKLNRSQVSQSIRALEHYEKHNQFKLKNKTSQKNS